MLALAITEDDATADLGLALEVASGRIAKQRNIKSSALALDVFYAR